MQKGKANALIVGRAAMALCCALLHPSCDGARKIMGEAKTKVEETARLAAGAGEGREDGKGGMDPSLAAWIDRNEEGILFRRDLPFPASVAVQVRESESLALRIVRVSDIGKQALVDASVRQQEVSLRRDPGSLTLSGYLETFQDPVKKSQEGGPLLRKDHPLLSPDPPDGHSLVLRGGQWQAADTTSFAKVAHGRQIGPMVPELLQEYAMSPRSMWFGKRRILPGKSMEISGELLPMLVAGKASGSLTLTLEDIEAVEGHPCARFAVSGSYKRHQFPHLDGRLFDEETSIQSGHVWLSVIHPLVLRYRYDRIVTILVAEGSGPALRCQGTTSPARTIAWRGLP